MSSSKVLTQICKILHFLCILYQKLIPLEKRLQNTKFSEITKQVDVGELGLEYTYTKFQKYSIFVVLQYYIEKKVSYHVLLAIFRSYTHVRGKLMTCLES